MRFDPAVNDAVFAPVAGAIRYEAEVPVRPTPGYVPFAMKVAEIEL
jgi:hypothetical protein